MLQFYWLKIKTAETMMSQRFLYEFEYGKGEGCTSKLKINPGACHLPATVPVFFPAAARARLIAADAPTLDAVLIANGHRRFRYSLLEHFVVPL